MPVYHKKQEACRPNKLRATLPLGPEIIESTPNRHVKQEWCRKPMENFEEMTEDLNSDLFGRPK